MTLIINCSDSLQDNKKNLYDLFKLKIIKNQSNARNDDVCKKNILDNSNCDICEPVKDNSICGQPIFSECKKKKIFSLQNISNPAFVIKQNDRYLRFVKGYGDNRFPRLRFGSQNSLFTNNLNESESESIYETWNGNKNIINLMKKAVVRESLVKKIFNSSDEDVLILEVSVNPEYRYEYVKLDNLTIEPVSDPNLILTFKIQDDNIDSIYKNGWNIKTLKYLKKKNEYKYVISIQNKNCTLKYDANKVIIQKT